MTHGFVPDWVPWITIIYHRLPRKNGHFEVLAAFRDFRDKSEYQWLGTQTLWHVPSNLATGFLCKFQVMGALRIPKNQSVRPRNCWPCCLCQKKKLVGSPPAAPNSRSCAFQPAKKQLFNASVYMERREKWLKKKVRKNGKYRDQKKDTKHITRGRLLDSVPRQEVKNDGSYS